MAEIKVLTKNEFRKMQLLELEMLKEFDRVCRENNIKYTISGGTLIGAVRHKGFIPWDDDIDVCMLREEYEKFRNVSDQLNPDVCFFQDHINDKYYRWGYSKLRKTNTEYIRAGQEHIKCKTGFFIDIFPLDDIPKSVVGMVFNDFYCFCLRKILYSEVGKCSDSESKFMRKIYGLLNKIDPSFVYKRLEKIEKKSNNVSNNRVRCLTFTSFGKMYVKNSIKTRYGIPKEWLLDLKEYDFEGIKVFGTRDYDAALTYQYRDYMTLPPEDKRDPHSPVSSYSFDVISDKLKKQIDE